MKKTLNMLATSALTITATPNTPFGLDFGSPFEPQVKAYFERLGTDAVGNINVALVGQGVAAILSLAALEMLGGLPKVAILPFGSKEPSGWLDTADYRHNVVRPSRVELKHGEAFGGYIVLDGSGRGLTPVQLIELATSLGVREDAIRIVNVQVGAKGQVDLSSPEAATAGMIELLLASDLTAEDWTSGRCLFLPGGAGIVGALQALTIHGLSEAWPRTIRLNKGSDNAFHVEEVVDPQAMRQWAAGLARRLEEARPTVTLTGEIPEAFREALAILATEHGVTVRG